MKKIDIEGITIAYKDVSDLNHKVRAALSKIQRKREKVQEEFSAFRKKERGLKKFLGIKVESKDAIPA